MRVNYSLKNSITALISNIIAIIIVFISQTIFIKTLGKEYLGINSLFSNILTMFSFLELGIGSIITYKLYKPVSINDINEIKSLMNFYKKAYYIIALVTFLLALLILPFIKTVVGVINLNINIYFVYLLFTLNLSISYLFSYKRCLIYVYQKNYIINIIHIFYLILMNLVQIILLIKTKNFYAYLITKILFQILENIIITIICNKMYPYIKNNKNNLSKEDKQDIYTKIKALMYHQGAYVVICGSDNILISYFFGITIVGLYSNYNMIISAFILLCGCIIEETMASVGNMLVLENKENCYRVFKKIKLLNLLISIISSVIILNVITPFINIWLGKEYILSNFVLLVLVINYFITMERKTYHIFKQSAGVWEEDKYIPLIETILNIVLSLVCIKLFFLAGVFIGTILSSLILYLYSYPKYVYKKILGKSYKEYFKECLKSVLVFLFVLIITTYINTFFKNICLNILISVLVPLLLLFIIYKKNEQFNYYINLLKGVLKCH